VNLGTGFVHHSGMNDSELTNLEFMVWLLDTTASTDEIKRQIDRRALRLGERDDAHRDLAVRPAERAVGDREPANLLVVAVDPRVCH
jgi:hypothetical protein